MSSTEKQEIKYLKKISGISSLTIKGIDFLELDKQDEILNKLTSFYTKKFKPSDESFFEIATKKSVLIDIIDLFNKRNIHYNILKKIAEDKGGKLISTEYINNRHKMEFEDEKGFRFYRTPLDIKRGRWNNFAK